MDYGIHCCICGRYCQPVDSSTDWGSSGDIDPPDDDFYCKECVEVETKRHIEMKWVPDVWCPAKWHAEVARALGYKQAGPAGAAWSFWFQEGGTLPEGYVFRVGM